MIKLLTNPFEKYNENRLLLVGIVFLILGAIACFQFNLLIFGSLKIINYQQQHWYTALVNISITILSNVFILYVFARFRYVKTRWIDVLNVVLIAHIAVYILLFLSGLPIIIEAQRLIELELMAGKDVQMLHIPKMYTYILGGFAVVAILLLIYFFYLTVVGMKIAMNSKTKKDQIWIILILLIWNLILQFFNPFI